MAETQNRDIIQPLFPTFLAVSEYPDFAAQRESMVRAVHEIRDRDEAGRARTSGETSLGYTSFFTENRLYEHPVFRPLAEFILAKANMYASHQRFDLQNYELAMGTLWINLSPRFGYHADHIHPYSHVSAVFYVAAAQGSGDIIFRDPRPVRTMAMPPYAELGAENSDVFTLGPSEGRLLLFPPWLTHGVDQNRSQSERISLACNLEMRARRRPT